jgi:hypothetical protein
VKPAPAKLVGPDFRPAGSFDHEVSDGENWQKLADRYRVPAQSIIQSNFKTTDPYEINWYLREYVNCKVPTPDGYNWRFSTSAREGGIPGRAGKIFIVPNWGEIERAAKSLTKRYVKEWFQMCTVPMGMIDGATLTILPNGVRPQMRIDGIFAQELEVAGAPRQVAQGWAAHLQRGLEIFTSQLHANEPAAFPMFQRWPSSGATPLIPAAPWHLLNSSQSAIASSNWFVSQIMFPGLSHPELQGVIKRHGLWFHQAFQVFRLGARAVQVLGQGVANPHDGRVRGTATALVNFLQLPNFMD